MASQDSGVFSDSDNRDSLNKDPFKTPLNTQQLLKHVRGSAAYSIDSGFSEKSTLSLPGDQTPWSSHSVSPEVEETSYEKVECFQDNKFSPISHLDNSALKARRFKYPFDSRLRSLKLASLFDEEDGKTTNLSSHSKEDVDNAEPCNTTLLTESENPETLSEGERPVTSFNVGSAKFKQKELNASNYERSSSCSLSSSTDDLEFSLQEMSLEEFSSGSTGSLISSVSPINFADIGGLLSAPIGQTGQVFEDIPNDTESDSAVCQSSSSMSLASLTKSQSSSDFSVQSKEQFLDSAQQNFLRALLLTKKDDNQYKLPQSELHTSSSKVISKASIVKNTSLCHSPHSPKRETVSACMYGTMGRVPLLPHEYSLQGSTSQSIGLCKDTCHCPKALEHLDSLCQKEKPSEEYSSSMRSPNKRNSSRSSPDLEFMSLHSPTKILKTQLLSPVRSSHVRRVLRSPNKKAREKLSIEKRKVNRNILRSDLAVFEQSSQSFKPIDFYGACDTVKSSRDLTQKDINTEKNRISPSYSLDFKYSPVKKDNPSSHRYGHQTSDCPNSMVPQLKLQQIIEQFSPHQPSRLIGRQTGVSTFDIVGELTARHFLSCVQQILLHLSCQDLSRVCQVSKMWNHALNIDPIASRRLGLFISSQKKQAVLMGKENARKKLLGSEPLDPLTVSKGLLTTIQPQALLSTLPPPTKEPKPEEELFSGDKLRRCPQCQAPAKIVPCQDRAVCSSEACSYDFCTLCFSAFHGTRSCKPLCSAAPKDLAGSRKSRKNLKRL